MSEQVIPKEYEWIKEGVKVRHVKMSVDNMWVADGPPEPKGHDQWAVKIKDLEITVNCEFLMTEDDPPLYDSQGAFPATDGMGPFFLTERDDGFWECHHGGSGNSAYGQTKIESLKRMLLQYEHSVSHFHERWTTALEDNKQLQKARAVLAEHSEAVQDAVDVMKSIEAYNEMDVRKAYKACSTLIALADAIGGGE